MTSNGDARWLLLIHQLPPKPDYLRVKTRRRLHKIGAVQVKNTVYALPRREQTVEDFHWVAEEIRREGGEALVCEAAFIEGLYDEDIVTLFNKDRDTAYEAITKAGRELLKRVRSRATAREARQQAPAELARLRGDIEEIGALDFFGAEGRARALGTLAQTEEIMTTQSKAASSKPGRKKTPSGRTWVTRANIFVDRMASAWLIKRFIDSRAQFRFADADRPNHKEGELRFDMFEGEYTHRGDRCTFEVLLDDFGLQDPALIELAQIIHDIDLKDGKFRRGEAAGISLALRGIRVRCATDQERLAEGYSFFDGLYEELRLSKAK